MGWILLNVSHKPRFPSRMKAQMVRQGLVSKRKGCLANTEDSRLECLSRMSKMLVMQRLKQWTSSESEALVKASFFSDIAGGGWWYAALVREKRRLKTPATDHS